MKESTSKSIITISIFIFCVGAAITFIQTPKELKGGVMFRLQEIESNNVKMIEQVYKTIQELRQDLYFVPGIKGDLKSRSDEYMENLNTIFLLDKLETRTDEYFSKFKF